MNKYAVINLKTDPVLKKKAAVVASKLGISISAVLNNELKRFAAEQSVVFELPEVPNAKTAAIMAKSNKEIKKGDYFGPFETADETLASLHTSVKSQ